ncbi:MAG: hypothetical protein ABEI53_03975, partial [Candidatus Magasanikbacteria bacterium]
MSLLEKFGLEVNAILDWDIVKKNDLGVLNRNDKGVLINQKNSKNTWGDVVQDIKQNKSWVSNLSKQYNQIEQEIENKYQDGIYILKKGEIEDYIDPKRDIYSVALSNFK